MTLGGFAPRLEECFGIAADTSRIWRTLSCDELGLDVQVSNAREGEEYALLLFRRNVAVSIEHLEAVTRPEAVGLMSEMGKIYSEAKVLRNFAPGDAILTLRLQGVIHKLMFALLSWNTKGADSGVLIFRSVRRCDFPEPGRCTTVNLQMDENLSATDACWIDMMAPGDEPGTAVIRKIVKVPRKYEWFLPVIAKVVSKNRNDLNNNDHQMAWITDAKRESFTQAAGFMVLRMRKCCRGPPLLPISAHEAALLPDDAYMFFAGEYWTPAATKGDFQLCEYLHYVLTHFGRRSDQIYDSLDGRYVAFFQAVVRRDAWPHMQAILNAFMPRQQAAYRHWYGGSGAPTLQTDAAPLWLGGGASTITPPEEESDDSDMWPWQQLSCKNTFVHFASRLLDEDAVSAP